MRGVISDLDNGRTCNKQPESIAGIEPLHCACSQEMTVHLIDRGADCKARSFFSGDTPMHRAGRRGLGAVVGILLKNGARAGSAFNNAAGFSPTEVSTKEVKLLIDEHKEARVRRAAAPVEESNDAIDRADAICEATRQQKIDHLRDAIRMMSSVGGARGPTGSTAGAAANTSSKGGGRAAVLTSQLPSDDGKRVLLSALALDQVSVGFVRDLSTGRLRN